MLKRETTFVYVMSEKRAREKICERYADKENLSITSCIPGQKDDKGYEVTFSYDEPKKKFSLDESYVCSVCGKKGVKLWRPYGNSAPLICAVCAEERQSPYEYDEVTWEKESEERYTGTPTGIKLPLPKWKVDEKGHVPSYRGPGPEELPRSTDHLIINLGDVSESYSSGITDMIPAVPDSDGSYWCYTTVPEDRCIWWDRLPTR